MFKTIAAHSFTTIDLFNVSKLHISSAHIERAFEEAKQIIDATITTIEFAQEPLYIQDRHEGQFKSSKAFAFGALLQLVNVYVNDSIYFYVVVCNRFPYYCC